MAEMFINLSGKNVSYKYSLGDEKTPNSNILEEMMEKENKIDEATLKTLMTLIIQLQQVENDFVNFATMLKKDLEGKEKRSGVISYLVSRNPDGSEDVSPMDKEFFKNYRG
jgi:uncharacterized tellurite resistance protein B-like protein